MITTEKYLKAFKEVVIDSNISELLITKALEFVGVWRKISRPKIILDRLNSIELCYKIDKNKILVIIVKENEYIFQQWIGKRNISSVPCDLEKLIFLCIGHWCNNKFKLKIKE